jgi:ABC-2 type transport system ATP-binding protein
MVVDFAAPLPGDGLVLPQGAVYMGAEAEGIRHSIAFDPRQLSAAALLAAVSATAEVADLSLHEPDRRSGPIAVCHVQKARHSLGTHR